jgi:NADP-dependent 3-hydroxy acid dehydrogenase YdfG
MLGTTVFPHILDVTDQEAAKAWLLRCEEQAPLNLVIANAGVATLSETTENIYKTFNTNVNGVLNTVLPAIEIYKNRFSKEQHIDGNTSLDAFIKKMKAQKRSFQSTLSAKNILAKSGVNFITLRIKPSP